MLAWIEHRVGRTKAAACAGTAQTLVLRTDTLSARLAFDWRSPFRLLPGLLGPAYNVVPRHARCESIKIMIKSRRRQTTVLRDYSIPCAASQRSASRAAMQPVPAAVIA